MSKADLIVVTDGEHTIEVTEKAFDAFYSQHGYETVAGKPKAASLTAMKKALKDAGIDVPDDKDAVAALYATLPAGE